MINKEPDFKTRFCEVYRCSPEQFETKLFWKCLFPHAVVPAFFLKLFLPDYFKPDLQTLHSVARCASLKEVLNYSDLFRDQLNKYDHSRFERFLRKSLGLRVSGERVADIARKTFKQGSGKGYQLSLLLGMLFQGTMLGLV